MAWYQEKSRNTYVGVYKNERDLRKDIEEAAKFGWVPQQMAGTSGHINVGRTVAPAVLTGGFSLLLGASRSKDKHTVTFLRDDRWMASQRIQDASRTLEEQRAKLSASFKDLGLRSGEFERELEAARKEPRPASEEREHELAKSVKKMFQAAERAQRERQACLAAASSLNDALRSASKVGAVLPNLGVDLDGTMMSLRAEISRQTPRLQQQRQLDEVQDGVVRAAKDWTEASQDTAKSEARLTEVESELAKARAMASTGASGKIDKLNKAVASLEEKVLRARAEVDKRRADLDERLRRLEGGVASVGNIVVALSEDPSRDGELSAPAAPAFEATPVTDSGQKGETRTSPDVNDRLALLEKLAELHKAGVLTDEEFQAKKADILEQI